MAIETAYHSHGTETAGTRTVTELSVSGMTCNNCARHVSDAIRSVAGVQTATVNLEAQKAELRWASGAAPNIRAVIEAIKREGYGAKAIEPHEHTHDHGAHKLAGWQLNLWIGVLGTLPLMVGEWVFNWSMLPWFRWFSFALAAVVQVFAGARFYRGAWNQLKVHSSNMDTLVALGSSTAFVYSAWALFSGQLGHLYFMEAAAIITLISVGHWMESRVSERASDALRKLLNLAPPKARRIQKAEDERPKAAAPFSPKMRGGDALVAGPSVSGFNLRTVDFSNSKLETRNPKLDEEVLVADLRIGDLVSILPGDRVPTDGEVIEGSSAVDEAMLTGESAPVDKTIGKQLYAGTVNLNGRLVMRVTATGDETALAHIITAVQRAQSSRANIQRLGDQVSGVFVPVVVAVAVAAALWWGFAHDSALRVHNWLGQFLWHAPAPETAIAAAFIIAAAVLIIACPCAMGLATPAAIMAGSNAAAQRGILIRDGVALEKAGEVTAVVFDKTGTLTFGRPEVAKIWRKTDVSPVSAPNRELQTETGETPVLRLAASLARHSTHPISQAIARISSDEVELTEWKEVPGAGVQATIKSSSHSQATQLGSLRWLRDSGVNLAAGEKFIAEWSGQGATIVGMAGAGSLLGLFAVKDVVKPGAHRVVEQLQRQGLKTFLVTGDNALTAASIASQCGIAPKNVEAEVRPESKADFVKQLQQQGERVAFVGDGINDAPALEQADLGIAVSRASDIAREAADIILLRSEIEAVPESLGLARATLRTIRQNLFWAFFYNAIGVPLAALGFMSPILCAAAMGFSDLIVIGNALRLRRWKFSR